MECARIVCGEGNNSTLCLKGNCDVFGELVELSSSQMRLFFGKIEIANRQNKTRTNKTTVICNSSVRCAGARFPPSNEAVFKQERSFFSCLVERTVGTPKLDRKLFSCKASRSIWHLSSVDVLQK